MRRLSNLVLPLLLGGLFSLSACGDKKKASEDKAAPCESDADCERGQVCLAKLCANAAPGAVYDDPRTAVDSEKVKAHMEMMNKAAEDRVDKALEGAGAD